MVMFFEPNTFLHGDPENVGSVRDAKRLQREARQRAGLCRCMVQVAAKRGYGRTSIDEAVRLSSFGKGTFYKLFDSREACLLEAFERCAEVTLRRVGEAAAGVAEPAGKAEAGLRTLVEILAAEPDVARLLLVEIRVGGTECR